MRRVVKSRIITKLINSDQVHCAKFGILDHSMSFCNPILYLENKDKFSFRCIQILDVLWNILNHIEPISGTFNEKNFLSLSRKLPMRPQYTLSIGSFYFLILRRG